MMKKWPFLFEMLWFKQWNNDDDTPHKHTTLLTGENDEDLKESKFDLKTTLLLHSASILYYNTLQPFICITMYV